MPALDDLVCSLDAAQDLLGGVDVLLDAQAPGRSARALLAMAVDLVAQAAQLARALPR
ncbi:MAG: hypothetical protein ACK44A_05370 [Roseateles sp.]